MMMKKVMKYFSKHPMHNAIIHAIAGIGIGMLLAYPVAGVHPVRWGVTLVLVGILGHVWAGMQK